MFFDPTCKPETKADPFTLESLIVWLEKQPADRKYNWMSISGLCLIDQYIAALGLPTTAENYRRFDVSIRSEVACAIPWTFGAALERAREALAQSGGN